MRTLTLLSLGMILHAAPALGAEAPPILQPQASALPFTHQGPFVSAMDGSVVCIDGKNVLRGSDEGLTWSASPLFAEPAKFAVSNERTLLRTRKRVIIAGWMNMTELPAPKDWRWGEKDVSWKDFVLPTCVCRSVRRPSS